MRNITVVCDHCYAIQEEDPFWMLSFSREVVKDDITEYHSETWDLCGECYAVISPTIEAHVQPEDEEE